MQTLKSILSLLTCFFMGSVLCEGQSASNPIPASVCSVRTQYKTYASSYIAIDAKVLADGMHGSVLLDDRCPNLGLALGKSLPDADDGVAAFEKALWSSNSTGTLESTISGHFVGRLRRDKKTKKIHFDLLSVKDLHDSSAKGWTPQESAPPPSVDLPGSPLHEAGHAASPKEQ